MKRSTAQHTADAKTLAKANKSALDAALEEIERLKKLLEAQKLG